MATSDHSLSATSTLALSAVERSDAPRRSRAWRRFRRYRPGLVGLGFIVLLTLVAVFAPVLAPYSPIEVAPRLRGDGPSANYLLGNDELGRDILSRIIYGSRVALIVGLGATAIAIAIGVTIGAVAGYFGGWVDALLSRVVDTLMAFPTLALLITLAAVLGPSLVTVIVAIGTTVWASYSRVVRADMMSLRERDYVLAARAAGATDRSIIFRHMIPNVLGPIVVLGSLSIGSIIILESALSFLGLGIQPPNPSWGRMLADGRTHIRQFPHIAIFPGLMITVTVLAFNLVGDGLRDALDPRQRE